MSEPSECVACWDDLTDETRCHFRAKPSPDALVYVSGFCWSCATQQVADYYVRWKKSVDEADCAAMLRRQIGKGPPSSYADADPSLVLTDEERADLYQCQVSNDGKEWISGMLGEGPKNPEEKEALWAQLRLREAELPENPADDEKE